MKNDKIISGLRILINNIIIFARFLEAEGLEKTYHFKQSDIVKAADISTANKVIVLMNHLVNR